MSGDAPQWTDNALIHLRTADPILAAIIERVGPLQIKHRPQRFQSLVRAIIFQQLAGRAAQTIFGRFVTIAGGGRFPTPAQVLAVCDEDLRRAGLSRGKTAYIRDLAAHVRDGTLNFHRFARMDDEEIIADLIRVRGIGRWTAEMFLMFNLRRPDVLPVDDLGIRNAVGKAYRMERPPTAKELREFGERWRPYRSAASWYLWRSADILTPGAADKKAPKAKPVAPVKRAARPRIRLSAKTAE